jgi:hypothetical protein
LGFGFGSGGGSARFIRASVFAAQRVSSGVAATNTGMSPRVLEAKVTAGPWV